MADISDIEKALVTLASSSLFTPSPVVPGTMGLSPVVNAYVNVYRGWPISSKLNEDLQAGRSHVSVFSDPGMTRDVSRWPAETVQVATATPTLTAAVVGADVTIGGTVTAGNVVGVRTGLPSAAYAYKAIAGDTLTTIAAALAAKVPGATSIGAVITLPTITGAAAAVMAPQPAMTITRQQVQGMRLTVWAPSPGKREAIAKAVDTALASMRNANGSFTRFFPVGTYEAARLQYRSTYTFDTPTRDQVWRKDLCYSVEYPTTLLEQNPLAMFIGGALWAGV